MTTLAIVGSRDYAYWTDVTQFVAQLKPSTQVVSGAARGVDKVAAKAARERGLLVKELPADWDRLGRSLAGYARNSEIVLAADYVVGFWNGRSWGTLDTLVKAIDHGQKLYAVCTRGLSGRQVLPARRFTELYTQQLTEARKRYLVRGCWPSA